MDVLSNILQGTALAHLPLGFSPNPEGGGGNPIMGLLPLLMVMVIFFLLIIRPQQKRQKQHQKMIGELKRGDRVLTNGGIFATIVDVKDEYFVATIAEGVKVEIARNAVAGKSEKKS